MTRALSRGQLVVPATLVGYLAVSTALFWRLATHLGTWVYGGQDPFIFVWWLRWVPYALGHGLSPLATTYLNHPYGVNGMWNTSMLLLGLLTAPLTLTIGPLATFNLLLLTAPALSGFACFLVARRLMSQAAPAVLAGLVYGFSPYMAGQSAGHLQLTWAMYPPVVLLLGVQLFAHQSMRPWALGLLIGLATSAQLMTGEEILASTAVIAAGTGAVLAVVHRHQLAARLPYALRALAVAACVSVALCAPGLATQFLGHDVIHGPVQHVLPGADLVATVVPTRLQALHPASNALVHRVDGGNLSEQNAYFGLPLLAVLVLCGVALRRRRNGWLVVPLVVAFVLTLGPRLVVYGWHTGAPLPWVVLRNLPVFSSIIPVRLCLYVFLAGGLLLGAWLDERLVASRERPRAWVPAAALCCVAVLPLVPHLPLRAIPAHEPAFFTRSADLALIPAGSTVLLLPHPSPGNAAPMWWQADSGMRFAMPGGYFLAPDRRGRALFGHAAGTTAAIVDGIQAGQAAPGPASDLTAAARAELSRERFSAVLLGPARRLPTVLAYLTRLTGVTPVQVDGVWLFRLAPR